jgi:hypothetical protein
MVLSYSPPLADKFAVMTENRTIEEIAIELAKVLEE